MSQFIHIIFSVYTLLLVVRIIGSWFPDFSAHPIMVLIGQVTDPYLNIFRSFIPPIGGMIDISPIVAFFALQFLEYILKRLFS